MIPIWNEEIRQSFVLRFKPWNFQESMYKAKGPILFRTGPLCGRTDLNCQAIARTSTSSQRVYQIPPRPRQNWLRAVIQNKIGILSKGIVRKNEKSLTFQIPKSQTQTFVLYCRTSKSFEGKKTSLRESLTSKIRNIQSLDGKRYLHCREASDSLFLRLELGTFGSAV